MKSAEFLSEKREENLYSPERERRHLLIGINGATGVGKSTLAGLLAEKFEVRIFEEQFRENPYLEDFYANPARWSFHSQIFFIEQTIEQMSQIPKLLKDGAVVVDPTHWQHAEIYAWVQHQMGWMTTQEYKTYFSLYEELSDVRQIPSPDLVFSVHAPIEVIIQRIKDRGRGYELQMLESHPDYFPLLVRRTEEWAQENPHNVPITIIDAYKNNYVDDPIGIFKVMAEIQRKVNETLGEREDLVLPEAFRLK